jgi:hypothetical protein
VFGVCFPKTAQARFYPAIDVLLLALFAPAFWVVRLLCPQGDVVVMFQCSFLLVHQPP